MQNEMVDEIHQQFIKVVREGRGKRLKETPEMFSGLVWSGEKVSQLVWLMDFGGLDYVARDVIMAEQIVDFTEEVSLLRVACPQARHQCGRYVLQPAIVECRGCRPTIALTCGRSLTPRRVGKEQEQRRQFFN